MSEIAPHSMEAEQGVLGSMLINPDHAGARALERLSREHFYHPPHRILFDTYNDLVREQKPIDFITLTTTLRDTRQLDNVGGPAAVSHLWTFTPTAANVDHYIDTLIDKWRLRNLIRAATTIGSAASDGGNVDDLEGQWQDAAVKIAQSRSTDRKAVDGYTLAKTAITRMENRFEQKGEIPGIPSGIPLLDHICRGAGKGQFILIGAPRKHGKSTLLRQWAANALWKHQKSVGMISLEMSKEEMTDALIHSRAQVSTQTLEGGSCSQGELERLQGALREFSNLKIFIRDESMMTPPQILAAGREMVIRFGVDMLCVDYLQLIRPMKQNENRSVEVGELSRWMKLIAKELNIPVLVATQLNKKGETRESSQPEMDCDKMIQILVDGDEPEDMCDADLWVKLHRGGETGKVPVKFKTTTTTFFPVSKDKK